MDWWTVLPKERPQARLEKNVVHSITKERQPEVAAAIEE
jgi:hypothetical protein